MKLNIGASAGFEQRLSTAIARVKPLTPDRIEAALDHLDQEFCGGYDREPLDEDDVWAAGYRDLAVLRVYYWRQLQRTHRGDA